MERGSLFDLILRAKGVKTGLREKAIARLKVLHIGDEAVELDDIVQEIETRPEPVNGMVERFNGRISDIVNQTRFGCAFELESALRNYVKIDNHSIPQRALKHQTPIQALKMWQEKTPDLLLKRVYNHTGLNNSRKAHR